MVVGEVVWVVCEYLWEIVVGDVGEVEFGCGIVDCVFG